MPHLQGGGPGSVPPLAHQSEFDEEPTGRAAEPRAWSGISARKCHGFPNSPARIPAAMRRFPMHSMGRASRVSRCTMRLQIVGVRGGAFSTRSYDEIFYLL